MQMQTILVPIKENYKTILQVAFGLLFVGLGLFFIRHESANLLHVKDALLNADLLWVMMGLFLLVAYVVVQGMMYQSSFASIHQKIKLSTGVSLFLKRNLVSVFLPAGVLTNLFFFNEEVERKEGVSKTQTYFASSVFSICSILSAVVIGVPALIWLLFKNSLSGRMVLGVLLTAAILGFVIWVIVSVVQRGVAFQLLQKKIPAATKLLNELSDQKYDPEKFLEVLGLSLIIEIIGIVNLYISVLALGGTPSWEMAIIGYAVVLLLLMSSPFLRGIGAVEVALTYALTLFGMSTVLAISVAFLFRFFEFWGVLVLGGIALVAQRDNLLLRVLPAILLFTLGLVNLLSGLTPAIPSRLKSLSKVIPMEAINASTFLVVLSGIIMLAVAVYLLRGLRNAWIIAVGLSAVSLIAHLSKGIDWEESIIAFVTLSSLIYQRHNYFIRPDLRLAKRSFFPFLVTLFGVLLFGAIGFYFLSPRHFNTDFSLWNSLLASTKSLFLLNIDLHPATTFGKEFLLGMNLLGGVTIAYFFYLLLQPYIQHPASTAEEDLQKAKSLVEKYGKGSLDYFKTYYDKKFWFSESSEGFVSFKSSRNYAVVLENPVCADGEALLKIIPAFDQWCRQQGLRSAYYRIPEANKSIYEKLGKKLFPIGEEAVLNLETFTTKGSDKKSIRNAINKISKLGYLFKVYDPPQKDAFLQQLKAVSNDWLKDMERAEIVFSQGFFDEKELKNQTILTLENTEGKVEGFINLIPDYTAGEANFDLMRKTADAPNGTMDFLFVKMFEHLKSIGFKACNMGMVPMSGIDDPDNIQERAIKLAYERIRKFGHYKSLRYYKEKFNPDWQMMYLVYSAPFDLIYLPMALERAIEP